jgi:glucosamine 6-phosphate synthetase-like amidotransferase/phosphosugar isomerase protein
MCSIIGSYSKEKFIELVKLNEYRGSFSYSVTAYNEKQSNTWKDFGLFNKDVLDNITDGDYILGHCQAPTNGLIRDVNRIHPYINDSIKILHNGIIKKHDVDRINESLGKDYEWDTQALGEYIKNDFNNLSDVEGSFACGLIKGNDLFVFRNAISPLYVDCNSNISSTKFAESAMIDYNTIYKLNNLTCVFEKVTAFNNTHNPYYF